MANRKRDIQVKFMVTEEEKELINEKMKEVGTENKGAYLRQMAIEGHIVKKDYTDIKKLTQELGKIGVNINKIVKECNENKHVEKEDIQEILKKQAEIEKIIRSTIRKKMIS